MTNIVENDGEEEECQEKPLLENNSENEEQQKVKRSLKEHKHLKEVFLLYILYTVLVMAGFLYSLAIPAVFTNYVSHKYPDLTPDQKESKASYLKSFSDSLPYISMFLFGGLGGVISDKYGRKPILYFTSITLVFDIISCYLTIRTNNLFIYYVVHTLAGANNIGSAAIFSYIADISDEEHVAILYSFLGVSVGAGVVGGPLIFIFTSASSIPNLTLYIAGGLTLLSLCIIPFMNESLDIAKQNNRIKATKTTSNPFKLIKNLFSNSGYLTWVILLYVAISYSSQDVISTYYYYCGLEYNWGARQNGLFLGGLGIMIMVWGAFLIPVLLKFYSERKIVSMGFLVSVIAHVFMIFSGNNKYFWMIGGAINSLTPNNVSLIQSVISRATPPNLQGTILTGVQAVGSFASFLGALTFSNLFSYFTSNNIDTLFFPQAPYLLNVIVISLTFISSLVIWKFYENPNPLVKHQKQEQSKEKINVIIN